MKMTFDRNLFTQVGLDSGSLTMLGTVVHQFREPGNYRGTVRRTDNGEGVAVFYIFVDKASPIAQANVDLTALTTPTVGASNCCCDGGSGDKRGAANEFHVNPRGYAVFHVSAGAGGFNVHVRKAEEQHDAPIFDSRTLSAGDMFSGVLIRPGRYCVTNAESAARGDIVVRYPGLGKSAYRPPAALRVVSTGTAFEPGKIDLHPGQGLTFDCEGASRIKIELVEPDDGPAKRTL